MATALPVDHASEERDTIEPALGSNSGGTGSYEFHLESEECHIEWLIAFPVVVLVRRSFDGGCGVFWDDACCKDLFFCLVPRFRWGIEAGLGPAGKRCKQQVVEADGGVAQEPRPSSEDVLVFYSRT